MHPVVLLAYFPKATASRFHKATEYFKHLEDIWFASEKELREVWKPAQVAEFICWRKNIDEHALQKQLQKESIQTIPVGDDVYPKALLTLYDPPLCLFVRGTLHEAEKKSLAVVGTRRCSPYGKMITETLIRPLGEAHIPIISGLAYGIDAAAHRVALQAGTQTIAVLGGGVDTSVLWPAGHRSLANDIITTDGAIISEYPPLFQPTLYSFPARNRIIAALSSATLVVEAPITSGAMITAKYALELGKEVFAVPHNLTNERGAGTNMLIRDGAHMIAEAADLLSYFDMKPEQKTLTLLSEEEQKILKSLSSEPIHLDDITEAVGLPAPQVGALLTALEMSGDVYHAGGMRYTRRY